MKQSQRGRRLLNWVTIAIVGVALLASVGLLASSAAAQTTQISKDVSVDDGDTVSVDVELNTTSAGNSSVELLDSSGTVVDSTSLDTSESAFQTVEFTPESGNYTVDIVSDNSGDIEDSSIEVQSPESGIFGSTQTSTTRVVAVLLLLGLGGLYAYREQ